MRHEILETLNIIEQKRIDELDVPQISKEEAKKIIRATGQKVTTQRLVILRAISRLPKHFTALALHELVSKMNNEIGFATVYRFLKRLTKHGMLLELRVGGAPARYEWRSETNHFHLNCKTSGQVIEFESVLIDKLVKDVAKRYGYRIERTVFELYGVKQSN
jgi:Fur family ferric uptake transcriptional regulator